MTATTPPAAPKAAAKPAAKTDAATPAPVADDEPKKLGITVGRLRAIDTKVTAGGDRLQEAVDLLSALMVGREERSSEKVDALRAIGSRLTQLNSPIADIEKAIADLIELTLDDD